MSPPRAAVLLLCLLAAVLAPAAGPKKKKKVESTVKVTGLSPERVRPGDSVTITGSHLDEVTAVLLEQESPKIVEKTSEKLVFVVSAHEQNPYYSAPVYLVLSGQPLVATRFKVSVAPEAGSRVDKKAGVAAVDEKGTLTANHPKSWSIALADAGAIDVTVTSKGGEIEARIDPAREGEPPLAHATYSGSLRWKLLASELGSRQLTLSLATDAPKADYRLLVRRAGVARPAAAAQADGTKK